MRAFQALRGLRKVRIAATSIPNNLTGTGSRAAFIAASIAATLLIFAAGSQNIGHAWELGAAHSEFRGAVLALASAGATLLCPFCFLAVARAGIRNFGTALTALVLGLGCLAYAATCSLGFVAGSRDRAIAERTAIAETRADAQARFDLAKAEIVTLKGQSPRILERRRELIAILADVSREKHDMSPAAQPDSQAGALAFYLRAAGWSVDAEAAGTWLNLAMVLFLEAAAALSLIVAVAHKPVGGPPAPVAPDPGHTTRQPETRPSESPAESRIDSDSEGDDPPAPKGRPGRKPSVLPAEAVERLRQRGGKATGSLNVVGKLIGTRSKTAAHRLLHQLASAGLVTLVSSPSGVSVALA